MPDPELVTISARDERSLIVDVLAGLGARHGEAADQADLLLEGDLRARPSHGIQRLPVMDMATGAIS